MQFLAKFEPQGYALLRIVTGLLFLWHGTSKLFSYPVPPMEGIPAFVKYGAGGIELVGGVLVTIGFLTRPAAFVCSGTMAVAYWIAHGMSDLFPIVNRGELAVLYCFAFLYIATRGGGVWSVDGYR